MRLDSRSLIAAAFALASGATPPVADAFRLPSAVLPLYQRVDLVLDPRDDAYWGSTRLTLQVHETVRELALHAEEMTIEGAELTGQGVSLVLDPATFTSGEMGRIGMPLPAPVSPGAYVLEMRFTQRFNRQAVGLYKLETEGTSYAFTQFQATDARKAFPCFDEPAIKCPVELHLDVPEADVAFSNMPVAEERVTEGRRHYAFEPTPPISVYLVAMAVGPLEAVPIEGMGIPGRVIVPAGRAALAAEAIRVTPPILEALEAYFGTEHPFPKLDLVAVPEFWPGAMENAGLITFRDTVLLLDARATPGQKRYLVEVIAHEIAHQWFGDLVTMEWWDDLWLNEAFATWMENKIGSELFPAYGFDIERIEAAQRAMDVDTQVATRAIRQPVESLASLLQSADILAYEKGQAVLYMFEQWMGPEAFQAGVRAYLGANAWGNATAADLFAALSEAAGIDVGAAMATFLDQPGVPIVHAEVLASGEIRLTQSRALNHGAEAAGDGEPLWSIPVRLRFRDGDGERTANVLLTERSQLVDVGLEGRPVWLHPNAEEAGYYRWSLPADELLALAGVADEVLSTGESVGLVSTLSALLTAGGLHGDEFLRVLEVVAAGGAPEVLDAAISQLEFVEDVFVTATLEEPFAVYVRRVLRPALARYGFAPAPEEPQAVTVLRPRILRMLAVHGRDAEVNAWAKGRAAAYLESADAVAPSLASAVLTIAAYDGDRAFWEACRERFEAADVPDERRRFLSTLGDFSDPRLMDAALEYALDPALRPQEIFRVTRGVSDVAERDSGVVFGWVRENYDEIVSRIPPPYLVYLPYSARGCSLERLEEALAFFAEPAHAPPGIEPELAKVAEAVRDCVALAEREGGRVASYLEGLALAVEE